MGDIHSGFPRLADPWSTSRLCCGQWYSAVHRHTRLYRRTAVLSVHELAIEEDPSLAGLSKDLTIEQSHEQQCDCVGLSGLSVVERWSTYVGTG